MRVLICFLCVASVLLAQDEGYVSLFDGKTLTGWTQEGAAQWKVSDGAISTDGANSGWLRSNGSYSNFILKLEFKTAADGNSGVFLRSAKEGPAHETGYELQIFDQHPKFTTGSLVNHAVAKKATFKANEWNAYEVTVMGDRFIVNLNGEQVLDARDSKAKSGHVGLQVNKDKPIAFRNMRIKEIR